MFNKHELAIIKDALTEPYFQDLMAEEGKADLLDHLQTKIEKMLDPNLPTLLELFG